MHFEIQLLHDCVSRHFDKEVTLLAKIYEESSIFHLTSSDEKGPLLLFFSWQNNYPPVKSRERCSVRSKYKMKPSHEEIEI